MKTITGTIQFTWESSYELPGFGVDLAIDYEILPEIPETGPSYASGGEPGEPAECNIVIVRVLRLFATDSNDDGEIQTDLDSTFCKALWGLIYENSSAIIREACWDDAAAKTEQTDD